jgi:hypothetical protein
MIIIRYPSRVKPPGVGRSIRIIPTIIVIKNHFFWVTQKRKLANDRCENPNI